jgi:hypothetical protein
LFFAGEHTNPFYDWQGIYGRSVAVGLAAAGEILK